MKLNLAKIKKVYFDNYGKRRFFSADFIVENYSLSYPAFAFPQEKEQKIKEKFSEIFNFHLFNEDLDFEAHVIEDRQTIWGIVNSNGQIFSMFSLYLNEENLSNDIKQFIPKIEKDFPFVNNHVSKEDKINSIVALYLLENKENPMAINTKHYYEMLLLRNNLVNNLENNHFNKHKIKI